MAADRSSILVVRDDEAVFRRLTGLALALGSIAGLALAGYIASRQDNDTGGVIFGMAFLVFGAMLIWGLVVLFGRCERHVVDRQRRELILEVWGVMSPRVRRIPACDIREVTLLTSRNRQDDGYDSITKTESFVAVWLRNGEMVTIGRGEASSTADMPPSAALDEMRARVCEALGVQAGLGSPAPAVQGQAPPAAIDHDSVRLQDQFNRLVRIDHASRRIEIKSHPDNAARTRLVLGGITFAITALLLPPFFGLTNSIAWILLAIVVAAVLLMAAMLSPVEEERLTIDGSARALSQKKRDFCFGHERFAERTIAFTDIAAIAQGVPATAVPVVSGTIKHHLPYWVSPVSLRLKSGEAMPLYTRGWYAAAATAPDPLLAALRQVLPDVPVVRIHDETPADAPPPSNPGSTAPAAPPKPNQPG